MKLLGAILAGGRSSRFGSDKAAALLDGKPLVDHVRDALLPHVDDIVICGGASANALPDWPAPDLGPLGGLCAALRYARATGCDAVLSVGCDTPVIPGVLLRQLATARRAVFVESLPIMGYWPAVLATLLNRHLAEGDDRSMRSWARLAGAVPVEASTPIANVNRLDDLRALARGDDEP